jgi:hypothetical protein
VQLPTIYFDESGNTGQDLMNADQPWFVLSGVGIGEHDSLALLSDMNVKNFREIKFGSLRKSSQGRRALIQFYQSFDPASVRLSAFHKKFMVTTKMVDELVEPLAKVRGIDLYKRGANLAMSNLWHTTMPAFCGREAYDAVLTAFVVMVRRKTPGSVHAFYQSVDALSAACSDPEMMAEIQLLAATRVLITHVLPEWDRAAIDPAVPAFMQLCGRWDEALNGAFAAVHDDSLLLEQQKALLELFMDPSEPQVTIGYDRRKSLFPLRVTGLTFASSATVPQLQIADLLASGAAHWFKNRTNPADRLAHEIGQTPLVTARLDIVAPSARVTPKELGTERVGGINAVDHIAGYISRKRSERDR